MTKKLLGTSDLSGSGTNQGWPGRFNLFLQQPSNIRMLRETSTYLKSYKKEAKVKRALAQKLLHRFKRESSVSAANLPFVQFYDIFRF